ncbi:hypothetical protein [Methanospirillum hungatei]|jgi:hypothetical protein|uniref:hypothetical protein n=1 Tax=Methanospirillum hungatei TaxID=2203 RepID=UPI0009C456A8|nr:hypothetical protein [Methanospirillum hungatei]MBP9008624.1 hypothetical protein [Methanospirillum sp.]OQA53960.1 MAG: hypothetical protein BWY45_02777 [Euryarchaeota archaeon ADurb.Bin294]HOW05879.1 hypothetical protein [Methanospirillum hungatei]
MKTIFLVALATIILLCSSSMVTAEEKPGIDILTQNSWNGSWASDEYSLLILQNGSFIAGSYTPDNITARDPGLLKGTLSEDGSTFSGIWSEGGTVSLILADDGGSFSGTGTVNQEGLMEEPFTYTIHGTREGTRQDVNNTWTGTWKTGSKTYNLTQNGTALSGSYTPFDLDSDEPGLIDGVISEDGKIMNGTWIETGKFSFIMSDDGLTFNGTYTTELTEQAVTDSWNGIKI